MAVTYAMAHETNAYNSGERSGIASNSLVVKQGYFLKKASGFIALATPGDTIEGVSTDQKTFASDNQTVAMATVTYKPEPEINNTYRMSIVGGTITQADEGKFYDLDANQDIDGTTEHASSGQLQMVKYISATSGIFKVANT